MKKLFIVAGNGNLSGVPKYTSNLYLTLRSKYDVTVVADCNLGGFNSVKSDDLIILPGLASGRRWSEKVLALLKLRRVLSNADIVWAHSSFSILFTRLLKTTTDYKLIVTYHGLPFGPGRKTAVSAVAYLTEFVSSKIVDHEAVVISKLDESQLRKIKPRARCTYIPNASQSVERLENKPKVRNLKILMTTRDSHQKNLDYAIKLLNKLPKVTMDVYGSISEERKKLLLSQNTTQNTTFHGEVPNDRIDFLKYNMYLLTSRYEGFSLGLLEAISHGLLVATTNVGGAQEIALNNPYCALLNGKVLDDASKIEKLLCKSLDDEGAYDNILDVSARFSYFNWQLACVDLLEKISNEA